MGALFHCRVSPRRRRRQPRRGALKDETRAGVTFRGCLDDYGIFVAVELGVGGRGEYSGRARAYTLGNKDHTAAW